MADHEDQEAGQSRHLKSANRVDTVETDQKKGKHRAGSIQVFFDDLHQQNTTTTALLSSLLEQIQKQNRLLETLGLPSGQTAIIDSGPTAAEADIDTTYGSAHLRAPSAHEEAGSTPLSQRSSISASKPTSAGEVDSLPAWLPVKRLRQHDAKALFRIFLGAVHELQSHSELKVYVENRKVAILKNLKMEELESSLGPVWPTLSTQESLSVLKLSSLCKHGAAVQGLVDIKSAVSSISFHKLEAHSVDDVDGIHIALPTGAEKIPDDCLPFEHALLAFSQLVPFDGTWAHGEEDGPSTWAVVALLRDHIWPTHAEVISFYHTAPLPDIYCVTLTLSGLGPAIPASSTRDQSASIHGSSVSGLKLLRKSGTLHGPIAQSTFLVREYRKTLCVRLFPNRHQHRLFYSIVTITDEADRWFGYHTHDLTQRELASTYKPLYVYLSFVSKILRSLQEDWTEVLDRFNNEINVTLEQISTVPGLNDLLFDDRGLSTSRRYFVLLQHLRIYEEWIVGTSDGLMVWYEVCRSWLEGQNSRFEIELKKPGLSKECEGVLIAWKKLVKDSQAAFGPLLDRIRTKRQEVVTLRDGLFNATAVREALQGSRLNQQGLRLNRYVFIFTITTIIYLPLTFVTGFLGMNDLPFKMKNSMMPLSWMIIAFCLGTYLITFGSLGIYALSEKIKQKKPDDLHRQQESSANHKVDGDGTIGEARKRKEPPAASKGRQGSTGAPGNLVRRATDALSNAIPLKQRRSWRKKRADVPSQV